MDDDPRDPIEVELVERESDLRQRLGDQLVEQVVAQQKRAGGRRDLYICGRAESPEGITEGMMRFMLYEGNATCVFVELEPGTRQARSAYVFHIHESWNHDFGELPAIALGKAVAISDVACSEPCSKAEFYTAYRQVSDD